MSVRPWHSPAWPLVAALLLTISALAGSTTVVHAQPTPEANVPVAPPRGPLGAAEGSPAAQADALALKGDTAGAVALLNTAVRANKLDATSWYLLGVLQWEMARSSRRATFMKNQSAVRLLIGADTALRLATQFAPDSARYWLALGIFNRQSGLSTMRFAAQGQTSNALDAATKAGDKQLLAQASDQMGTFHWIRYEISANRGLPNDNQRIQLTSFNNWDRSKARDYVNTIAKKIEPPTGRADYERALERFQVAVENDSTNLRYSRHLYMAIGERKQWGELAGLAAMRARQFPLDYQAQLALGLAYHRLDRPKDAQRAYDSAFVLMDDDERERLTRFTRILRPKADKQAEYKGGDSLSFAKLPPEQQRGLEKMYWYMNDPLTLTTENEYRLEFLSRVVFADFRWTDEDLGYRGADTDRGDTYVRYGPPDYEVMIGGDAATSNGNLVWAYNNGLTFFFDIVPGFGTARRSFADRDNQELIMSKVPVSWDNLPSTRLIDTIPVRIARFRAGADSTDAVVAVRMPLDSIVKAAPLERVPVDVDFRVFDQFVRVQGLESSQFEVARDSADAAARRTWTKRLGPGINVVRVEALQADTRRAARAMAQLRAFETNGFGMSDVLLGSKPSPAASAPGGVPRRWRDVSITPNTGEFDAGASIGMVWEMYDLAARNGEQRYRVQIGVERLEKGGVAGFGLRVLDGLGRAVTRAQQGRNKIDVSFDRSTSASPTIVEYLSIDLTGSPPGRYRLRVQVEDRATNKKVLRESEFVIR